MASNPKPERPVGKKFVIACDGKSLELTFDRRQLNPRRNLAEQRYGRSSPGS